MEENVIEWFNNSKEVSITASQRKFINRIEKLKEENPDEVVIVRNQDGSIFAKLPVNWVKLKKPSKRELTDEERKEMAELFRQRMDKKGEGGASAAGGFIMNNKKLREYAAGKKVKLWQVAEKFGVSDVAFSKKLRHELSKEDAEQFRLFVDEIANEGGNERINKYIAQMAKGLSE